MGGNGGGSGSCGALVRRRRRGRAARAHPTTPSFSWVVRVHVEYAGGTTRGGGCRAVGGVSSTLTTFPFRGPPWPTGGTLSGVALYSGSGLMHAFAQREIAVWSFIGNGFSGPQRWPSIWASDLLKGPGRRTEEAGGGGVQAITVPSGGQRGNAGLRGLQSHVSFLRCE